MSYILEALKKSQRERELGRVPDLSAHQHLAYGEQPRSVPWGALAVAVAFAALLIALYGTFGRSFFSSRATPPHEAQSAAVAPVPVEVPSPPAAVRHETGAGSAPDEAVQVTPPIIPQAPTPTERDTAPQPAVTKPPPSAVATVDAAPQIPVAETLPVEEAAPEPPVVDEEADGTGVPLLKEMPEAFQRNVPSLEVNVHVYSGQAEGRFVFINMRRYVEGDRMAEGPVLESIGPHHLVLSYQGQRFRLLP